MEIGLIRTGSFCLGLILFGAAVHGSNHDSRRSQDRHSSYCNVYDSDVVRCACSNYSSRNNHDKACCKVQDEFIRSSIVPDFIPCAPCCEIRVEYPSGAKYHLGNTITQADRANKPRVKYAASNHRNFTLMYFSVDNTRNVLPGQTGLVSLVMGIQGSNVDSGDVIFKGLSLPAGIGGVRNPNSFFAVIRFVYLIYEEGPMTTRVTDLERARYSGPDPVVFSPTDFAAMHNLGNPVCANFAWVNKRIYSNQ